MHITPQPAKAHSEWPEWLKWLYQSPVPKIFHFVLSTDFISWDI